MNSNSSNVHINELVNIPSCIRRNGGDDADIAIWEETLSELEEFCDITPGRADDYTRDFLICWIGWCIGAPYASTCRICDSVTDVNIEVRDNEKGMRALKYLIRKIRESAGEQAYDVITDLASDELERMTGRLVTY